MKNFSSAFVFDFINRIKLNDATPLPSATIDSVPEKPSATLMDIPLAAGYGVDGGWFELYFTNPSSPLASQETGGIDAPR